MVFEKHALKFQITSGKPHGRLLRSYHRHFGGSFLKKHETINNTEEVSMIKCPFLNSSTILRCEVEEKLYAPSDNQLDQYCMTKKFKTCPFYTFMRETNNQHANDFITTP